LIVWLVN